MTTTALLRSSLIARLKNYSGYGCEVGVKQGHFSQTILERWNGRILFMVDAWRHFDGVKDIAQVSDDYHARFMAEARIRVAPYKDRAAMICLSSRMASQLFPDAFFDFVYLDAGHTKQLVLDDIHAWLPKVRKGGLICGDDYLEGEVFSTEFGVISALKEYFGEGNYSHDIEPEIKGKWIPQWWKEVEK